MRMILYEMGLLGIKNTDFSHWIKPKTCQAELCQRQIPVSANPIKAKSLSV